MILDTIDHLKDYVAMNPGFRHVIDFIANNNLQTLREGRHDIAEGVYVNVQRTEGKSRSEARLEYHRQMIDLQVPLACTEEIGVAPLDSVKAGIYDAENDIAFSESEPEQYIQVKPGEFAIFFPQDAHAPCIAPERLHKLIFKVVAS